MEVMPEDRARIISAYLEELERKGTPPPPTASQRETR
jgi:hypothetical protein